jgi:hypothetical protein
MDGSPGAYFPAFERIRISLQPEKKQPQQSAAINPQKGYALTVFST